LHLRLRNPLGSVLIGFVPVFDDLDPAGLTLDHTRVFELVATSTTFVDPPSGFAHRRQNRSSFRCRYSRRAALGRRPCS